MGQGAAAGHQTAAPGRGGCPGCLDKAVELVAMVLPATTAQRRLEGLGRRQVTATVLPVAPESRSEAAEGRGREDDQPKAT